MDAVSTTLLCPVPMPDLITYDITAEPRQGLVTLFTTKCQISAPNRSELAKERSQGEK